jgi:hypothetical protein
MPERTLDHEQGNVSLDQVEDIYLCLRGLRTTARRAVLAQHAQAVRTASAATLAQRITWEEAVAQTFVEIGHLVNETPEADLDDPLPPDYEPNV